MINEQASTGMFVPGFMATYCHTKLLLAALKAQKASPIVGTSETREHLSRLESAVVTKQLAD